MAIGKYGDASEDISEGTSEELVSEYDADRETGESSGTDREGSAGENGSTDERAAGTLSGSGEGERSDGMDSHMNSLTAMAEESILTELVYS